MSLKSSGGLDDAKWFDFLRLENINTYDDILPLLVKDWLHYNNEKHDWLFEFKKKNNFKF